MRKLKFFCLLSLSIFLIEAASLINVLNTAAAQSVPETLRIQEQADRLFNEGRYQEAEPLYQRLVAVYERALGSQHPNVGALFNQLGLLYDELARYSEAENSYKRSMAIAEKALGPNHDSFGSTLNNLAALYETLGRYNEAEQLLKRAISIKETGKAGPLGDATALSNLASLYVSQGRNVEAEKLYKRVLFIREKFLGPDHSDVGTTLGHLAWLYSEAGSNAEAAPLFRRSLSIKEKVLGPNHRDVATALNNLALFLDRQQLTGEAEQLHRRALAISEKVGGTDDTATAAVLNNLAANYASQRRYQEAERLYRRSLAIYERAYGGGHPDVALSLSHLAKLYREEGRFGEAEKLNRRSLDIVEKALSPNHPKVVSAVNSLVILFNKQKRYRDALPLAQRLIAMRAAKPGPTLDVLSNSQLEGLLPEDQGFAESYLVLQFNTESAAGSAVHSLSQRYTAGSPQLANAVRRDQDLSSEARALDNYLLVAASKTAKQRNQNTENIFRARIEAIEIERKSITTKLTSQFPDYVAMSKPEPLSLEDSQSLLDDNEAVVAFHIGEDGSYVWVVTKTERFWSRLKIKADELNRQILDLRRSLTFNVNRPFDSALAFKTYEDLFATISPKLAGKLRISVQQSGALTSIPLELLVTSDPKGKSYRDTDWLVKKHAVVLLPSIFSLKTMRVTAPKSNAPREMIAFADPIFSQRQKDVRSSETALRSIASFYQAATIDSRKLAEYLPQIPGTRDEIQAIAGILGVEFSNLKMGINATESTVKNAALDQYRIVYFATHALVAGEIERFTRAKAEPALVFSIPANPTEQDDGLLQSSEVARLKLNADWVVLSACNTASSDGTGAEALSGLARAFLYAGARSLVVSHWEVSDTSTAKLMTRLFRATKSNSTLSHSEALREAVLSMINSANSEDESHPRHWAPFSVVGEPAKARSR